MDPDNNNDQTLIIVKYIAGYLSLTCNFINIYVFFIHFIRGTTTRGHELLTYINFSALLNTTSYLLLFIDCNCKDYNLDLCIVQASLMTFSEISDIFIQNLISFYILKSQKIFLDEFNGFTRIINLFFIFGIPTILVGVMNILEVYGKNGRWCWIKYEYGSSYGTTLYVCIWLTILISVLSILYSRKRLLNLKRNLGENDEDPVINSLIDYNTKTLLFPAVFFISWIFPSINRLYTLTNDGKENNTLVLLHYIFKLSFGIFISFASVLFDWEWFKNNVFKCRTMRKICCDPCLSCFKDSENKEDNLLNANDLTQNLSSNNINLRTSENYHKVKNENGNDEDSFNSNNNNSVNEIID